MAVYVVTAKRDSEGNMRRAVINCGHKSNAAKVAAALWNALHTPLKGVYDMLPPRQFMLDPSNNITMTDWTRDFYVEVTRNPEPGEPLWLDTNYVKE